MYFEQVLPHIKRGEKASRRGWNGKGMYVYYVPAAKYKACTRAARDEFGDMVRYEPYLAIKNAGRSVSTWVPSINDIFAEDWKIIKDGVE